MSSYRTSTPAGLGPSRISTPYLTARLSPRVERQLHLSSALGTHALRCNTRCGERKCMACCSHVPPQSARRLMSSFHYYFYIPCTYPEASPSQFDCTQCPAGSLSRAVIGWTLFVPTPGTWFCESPTSLCDFALFSELQNRRLSISRLFPRSL